MNLIERLGLEKCKAIVDGAPKDMTTVRISLMADQFLYGRCENSVSGNLILLSSIRAAIADHNKCQHEWNETTSNGDKYRFFVCKHCDSTRNFIPLNEDITDYVSDIRNHISPLTKVIDK